MTLLRLSPLLLAFACTGPSKDDSGTPADTDTDTDTETDTDAEPVPVWSQHKVTSSSTLNGVYASGGIVYVAGTGAEVHHGNAGGWTEDYTGLDDDEDFSDLWGQGAGDAVELVLTATSGHVARRSNTLWTDEDLGTANHEGVGGSGLTALFAVSWGGIYAFDGASWSYEAPPLDSRLNEVWGIGGEVFAVGEAGLILRRTPGTPSATWAAMPSGVPNDLNAISGVSLTDVWAVGADGVALHFDGTAWTVTDTGVDEALWAVFAPAPDTVYAVGSAGTALLWDGKAWTVLPTGVDNNLYGIHGASSENVWAVGNRGMVLQYPAED